MLLLERMAKLNKAPSMPARRLVLVLLVWFVDCFAAIYIVVPASL